MSFLLSSFQFHRKVMDHNLLLKKSFRKMKTKIMSVELEPNTGLDRLVLRFLYHTGLDKNIQKQTHKQTNTR